MSKTRKYRCLTVYLHSTNQHVRGVGLMRICNAMQNKFGGKLHKFGGKLHNSVVLWKSAEHYSIEISLFKSS
jgi:hypothetical protein